MNCMKILVLSDSHGRLGLMLDAMERERPHRVFFLGDHYQDAQALADAYPGVPVDAVKGNCAWCAGPEELLVEAEGVRFLLTHGHRYYAKSGVDWLADAGREKGVDMVCFGHTHEALNMPRQGVWLFNPGTAGGVRGRPGYGVLIVEKGTVRGELK